MRQTGISLFAGACRANELTSLVGLTIRIARFWLARLRTCLEGRRDWTTTRTGSSVHSVSESVLCVQSLYQQVGSKHFSCVLMLPCCPSHLSLHRVLSDCIPSDCKRAFRSRSITMRPADCIERQRA